MVKRTAIKQVFLKLLTVAAFSFAVFFTTTAITHAAYTNVNGYAWSSNIGWICFDCGTANVQIDPATGAMQGYAWSHNIGWITMDPTGGFPTSPSAGVYKSGSNIVGWMRALSYGGGWDGWIKTDGWSNDVTVNTTTGDFTGFAWGGDVVGWVDFSPSIGEGVNYTPPIAGNVAPTANAGPDRTITLPTSSHTISGASASDSDGTISSISWTRTSGPTSVTITGGSTLTPTFSGMTVAGTYVFRLTVTDDDGATDTDTMNVVVNNSATTECSDGIDNDGDGLIDMLDPGCSDPTDDDETNPGAGPTVTFSGKKNGTSDPFTQAITINSGEGVYLEWNIDADSCVSTGSSFGFTGTDGSSGSVVETNITANQWYNIRCTKDGIEGPNQSVFVALNGAPLTADLIFNVIVCDEESRLPNWGGVSGAIDGADIDTFLSTNSGHCALEDGWQFQIANSVDYSDPTETPQLGAYIGPWGPPWETVPGSTSGRDGLVRSFTQAELDAGYNFIGVRQVHKTGYLKFGNIGSSNSVNAEIRCHTDNQVYDNYEQFGGISVGNSYHCVGFHVLDKPSVTLTGPSAVDYGDTATLNLTVANLGGGSCTFTQNGALVGNPTITTNVTNQPHTTSVGLTGSASYTFVVTCVNSVGGTQSDTFTVGVRPNTPTFNLPSNIIAGATAEGVDWSAGLGATQCEGRRVSGNSVGWNGITVSISGDFDFGPITTASEYGIRCRNSAGWSPWVDKTISPIEPTSSFSASPQRVLKGKTSTLTWEILGVVDGDPNACTLYEDGTAVSPTPGSISGSNGIIQYESPGGGYVTPAVDTSITYEIECEMIVGGTETFGPVTVTAFVPDINEN